MRSHLEIHAPAAELRSWQGDVVQAGVTTRVATVDVDGEPELQAAVLRAVADHLTEPTTDAPTRAESETEPCD